MSRTTDRLERTQLLIAEFPQFLNAFVENPPFSKPVQLESHLKTIQRRRVLGTAENAINDDQFLLNLRQTLEAWGIGKRASKLKSLGEFTKAFRAKATEIVELDTICIDDPNLDVDAVGNKVWKLIDTLEIVTNETPIVSTTKALHHILPDLVVPIDRAYTQRFFLWQNPVFQYGQAKCFRHAFSDFAEIGRRAKPTQYVGKGWNSSRTKIIDNAIVGLLIVEGQKAKAE